MDTETAEHPLQMIPNLEVVNGALAAERAWPRAPASLNVVDTAPLVAERSRWFSLLEAAQGERPARLLYCLVFKRWFDVAAASLLLLLLAPLFLLIALLIWLGTRGPVIYRQRRIGRHGVPFTIYKFCTMIPERRGAGRPYAGPDRRKAHKTASDPRVTRIGRVLRRSSIDELPQLFNVLRGQMSLIGPRPELPTIVDAYEQWQHQRHLVRPGITGWWQTHGRSDRMMHEHTELDIYYVEHISFGTDIRILLGTLRAVVQRSGAF